MAKYLSDNTRRETLLKTLFRYFVQGLVVLAPISLTVYILYKVFDWIDSLLRPAVFTTPGIGFILILAFVIFIGWLSSYFIMESVINFFDHWLERTPGIKLIYKSIKDFFQAFAGDKKKFTKAVLCNVFDNDVWIIGFLTDDEMHKFNMDHDMVGVYVPQAYNFAGQLYILPKDRVKPIENLTAGDAMKYTVTGGVVES
ncbi:MAG: DUF502 domain-containing protein [Niabella sp.]